MLSSWVVITIVTPLLIQLSEQVQNVVAGFDIDAGGRLVEKSNCGLADQGAGQKGALLLPA